MRQRPAHPVDPPGFAAAPGTILGHKFIGRVVEVGAEVREVAPGDRDAVAVNPTCGLCRYCKAGKNLYCENRTTIGIHRDGGFARYSAAPERALHRISPEVPFEEAVWTEPLSCVVNSTDRLAIQPGQTAVVIGAGPLGALHGMMFAAAGAQVIIADFTPFRLEVAAAAGLHITVDARSESLRECVMDFTDGPGAEVVVDAVGNQLGAVLELAAMEASIALFGHNGRDLPAVRQWDITRKQLTVFGSFVGASTFPRTVQILESGALKPSILNTMTLPLPEMLSGIEAARRGEAVKVLVLPE